jgi:phage terminase large subunit
MREQARKMRLTKTFEKTLKAYNQGYTFIANRGGTRSGKTFSVLQLFYLVAKYQNKKRIIHVVSHSTPHLKDGAIVDFEKILTIDGVDISSVRTQNPNTYRINKSIIKFIGFDKLGKALGAPRDMLLINEGNKMTWEVCHQLMIRTTECVFLDWNPAAPFWFQNQKIEQEKGTIVLNSTFLDNFDNLSEKQIFDLSEAKKKHDEELRKGIKGYWWNWWRVYGLGLDGQTAGAIFNYWREGDFDDSLPFFWVMDYGQHDPHTLGKMAIDWKNKKIYYDEKHYAPLSGLGKLVTLLNHHIDDKKQLIIADHSPLNNQLSNDYQFNVIPQFKPPGSVLAGIQLMQEFELIITSTSPNAKMELLNYIWLDKTGDVPTGDFNHIIDPIRCGLYYCNLYTKKH